MLGGRCRKADAGRKVSESDARNLMKSGPSMEINCGRVWKKVPEGDAGRKMSENDAGRKVSESGTWNLISPFSGNQLWQFGRKYRKEMLGGKCRKAMLGVWGQVQASNKTIFDLESRTVTALDPFPPIPPPPPPHPTFSSRLCSHASGQATISDHCRLTDLASTGQDVTFRLRHFPWWTTT